MIACFFQTSGITMKSGQFSTVGEVLNVLARLKTLEVDTCDYLEAAAKILDALKAETDENAIQLVASFAAEQLRLVAKPCNTRRYSSFLLANAII